MMAGGGARDAASDHYRRWREDIALMTRLSLQAHPERSGVRTRTINDSDRLYAGIIRP